jgi:hypothetical protein
MSLDLPQILPQVTQMGQSIIQRLSLINKALPQLLSGLEMISHSDIDTLKAKVSLAGENWPGAIPTDEPVHQSFAPPLLPKEFIVIASDGSQIHPDRHAPARYYLINIGSIRIHYGSGDVPETYCDSKIYYEDEHLYDEKGFEISPTIINGLRDLSEMEALAQIATSSNGKSTISLLDNGLLLWLAAQSGERPSRQIDQILQKYLQALSKLQKCSTAVAGFIDRPRHANVIALLHLNSFQQNDITEDALRLNPFLGISDQALFSQILEPGHRSALFIQNSRLNHDFRKVGHEVHFFYVCTGERNQIARVEVPSWVASSPEQLGFIHAALVEQCKLTGGYPYALVRAHELAVVSNSDRQTLNNMIQSTLLEHGWMVQHSLKSETKRWTAKRRRHRL